MIAALALASLLAAEPAAQPAAPAAAQAKAADAARAELLSGKLPADPARAVVEGKCLICHTGDYLTQQRLTPGQWQKTVEKMRKFGSPLTDDEVPLVSGYLGRNWTTDLPDPRAGKPVAPPKGSLPSP
ncbi:MAG TPA: hypothetical protein VLU43_11495 [Anaeromyxobacteraceae bacterium]|nr:hypothetical protein [Anaeromyxobacteraceae bacterium]